MFTDRPIEKSEDDILDRKDFSCMLGDVLISTKQNESLCVGLMGPWGSGKTSVINMAIEYICSEKRNPYVNVLRFEPWNYNTPEQLVNQFFVQLANLFEVGNEEKGKIGRAIVEYANCIEMGIPEKLTARSAPAER